MRGYHEEIQRLLVVLELVVDRAERGVRVRFVGYQTDHLGEQLDGLRVVGLSHREQHVRVSQLFGSLRADHALAGATDAASRLTASEVTPRGVRLLRGALEEHLVHWVLGYEREPIRVGDVEETLRVRVAPDLQLFGEGGLCGVALLQRLAPPVGEDVVAVGPRVLEVGLEVRAVAEEGLVLIVLLVLLILLILVAPAGHRGGVVAAGG